MIEIQEVENKDEWENFLTSRPEASFLQSWYWGEFYRNLGNELKRTGFYKDGRLVGVMLSIVENAKRARYLTVPGGPIFDWQDNILVQNFIEEVKQIAKDRKCAFVRVRPQLEASDFSQRIFSQNGFKNAPIHLHVELSSQLDITKPEEELLTNMRKTTRYGIKKALSLGISIIASKEPAAMENFYKLQLLTAKRKGFTPYSGKLLRGVFKVFTEADKALLYSAELEGKVLAEAIIIFYGEEAVYHYGASTEEGRKYPGAYLIQWEAIKEAKRRGLKRYNFWGVAPPENRSHRFSGISIFKRGFGGDDVEYLHAQDLIINYPKYLINYTVENIRKRVRNV